MRIRLNNIAEKPKISRKERRHTFKKKDKFSATS